MGKQIGFRLAMALLLCSLFLIVGEFLRCDPAFCETEGEEEEIQAHENPMNYKTREQGASLQDLNKSKLNVNDGEGPGGDKPSPVIQRTLPSAPAQTKRPSASNQTLQSGGPGQ